jgi:hypothetical protein
MNETTKESNVTPTASPTAPGAQTASVDLPLFYKNPVPLQPARHAKAGLRAPESYVFARSNAIAIAGSEFAVAARHYPIVFSAAPAVLPFVVVGLRDQENLFVAADGRWHPDAYIPAYVRRYPFVFVEDSESERLILCVDEAAERYEPESKHPFFVGRQPSPATEEALRFCEMFHVQWQDTLKFGEWIEQAGLLEDRVARMQLQDGSEFTLRGFRLINPEKMRTLTDEQVLHLHRKGWLPLLHFHLQSLNSWSLLGKLARESKAQAA